MLKHYWITAFRNLKRNKLFTSINVIGLSISIAIFLALTSYVSYHLSYDKFYEGGDPARSPSRWCARPPDNHLE